MRRICIAVLAFSATLIGPAYAQKMVRAFPPEVVAAKTVAIMNETHDQGVTDGAVEALKRWGKFTVVEDPEVADITLTFDKKSEHDKTNTEKTGDDGKTDYGFSMSFSSSVHMKAVLKGSETAFYTTTSGDSKKKAGNDCVIDFQKAYLAAR